MEKYKLQLVRADGEKETTVRTWDIPRIIKTTGSIKVKFLPSLREIKKAIKEDI